MPKTIHSKRNQLSKSELEKYGRAKELLARVVRPQMKAKFPEFEYHSIFTEARAGGALRSKFWISYNKALVEKIISWGNKGTFPPNVVFELHECDTRYTYAKNDLVIKIK